MWETLTQIWLFLKDGRVVFEFPENTERDNTDFGRFVSTIKNFSKELSGTDLHSFNMEKCKYTCLSFMGENLILVGRSRLEISVKKIRKFFDIFVKMFKELYKIEDILNWDGNKSIFEEFKKKLILYQKISNL
ncbi:MAG: hypothetical protein GF353_14890 [Candidatus Lokiarchaeota archaeon]|nr:hypothetical protein [Candidatus Lokiarchaeota archaeon]